MDLSEAEKTFNRIVKWGVFVRSAKELGFTEEEICEMVKHIAEKRKEKNNGKDL